MWPAGLGAHASHNLHPPTLDYPARWRPPILYRRTRSGSFEEGVEQSPTHSWDRRFSVCSAGRDLPDSHFRLKARENSLLDSLTYERALTQVAHEETLNSLATLKTIESHFKTVCAPDGSGFLSRRQSFSAKEDEKLIYRLSGVSSASSGPVANVSDFNRSEVTSNLLSRYNLASARSTSPIQNAAATFEKEHHRGRRRLRRRSDMVLVAPMTPVPSQREEHHHRRRQDDKETLLTAAEVGMQAGYGGQPRRSDVFLPNPSPDNNGTVSCLSHVFNTCISRIQTSDAICGPLQYHD